MNSAIAPGSFSRCASCLIPATRNPFPFNAGMSRSGKVVFPAPEFPTLEMACGFMKPDSPVESRFPHLLLINRFTLANLLFMLATLIRG